MRWPERPPPRSAGRPSSPGSRRRLVAHQAKLEQRPGAGRVVCAPPRRRGSQPHAHEDQVAVLDLARAPLRPSVLGRVVTHRRIRRTDGSGGGPGFPSVQPAEVGPPVGESSTQSRASRGSPRAHASGGDTPGRPRCHASRSPAAARVGTAGLVDDRGDLVSGSRTRWGGKHDLRRHQLSQQMITRRAASPPPR